MIDVVLPSLPALFSSSRSSRISSLSYYLPFNRHCLLYSLAIFSPLYLFPFLPFYFLFWAFCSQFLSYSLISYPFLSFPILSFLFSCPLLPFPPFSCQRLFFSLLFPHSNPHLSFSCHLSIFLSASSIFFPSLLFSLLLFLSSFPPWPSHSAKWQIMMEFE